MRICKQCEKPIAFDSRATKYCSEECRKLVKYKKDRAWVKANPKRVAAYAKNWYTENREMVKKDRAKAYKQKCIEKFKEA